MLSLANEHVDAIAALQGRSTDPADQTHHPTSFSKPIDGTLRCEGMYLRSNFNSSKLVRLLGDWQLADVDVSGPDFAERLSLWLGAFDAMKLHAVHQAVKTMAGERFDLSRPRKKTPVEDEFHRVKALMVKAITETPFTPVRGAHFDKQGRPIEAGAETTVATAVDYAPYRQRYLDQQHQMDMRINALRAHVRGLVSQVSPRLKQLAALDAVMGDMLAEREHKLLTTLPGLLKKRFEHLRQTHQQKLVAVQQPDDPTLWRRPGGWLNTFSAELHEVLLAELDVRLGPVMGLIEALNAAAPTRVAATADDPQNKACDLR